MSLARKTVVVEEKMKKMKGASIKGRFWGTFDVRTSRQLEPRPGDGQLENSIYDWTDCTVLSLQYCRDPSYSGDMGYAAFSQEAASSPSARLSIIQSSEANSTGRPKTWLQGP